MEEVVSIVLDTGDFERKLIGIDQALQANKKAQREYNEAIKEGNELTQDEVDALTKLRTEEKELRQSKQELTKAQKDATKEVKSAAGSIDEQRAKLARLTKEYNALSREQRENSAQGKALTSQIKGISDELKKAEGAIGDNRRSVGGYKEAILSAIQGSKAFGGALGTLGNVVKANPIGLLVTLALSLVQQFEKITPVTDVVNVALGALNAVIDVLVARAGKLVEAFTFLVNGEFGNAAKAAGSAFTGLGLDIRNAVNAGSEYAKVQKEIADATEIQQIANERAREEIVKLEKQLKDTTRTAEERLAIAKQIAEIERKNFEENDKIAKVTVENERKKLVAVLRTKGAKIDEAATTEELIRLAQERQIEQKIIDGVKNAEIQLIQNRQQSIALQERIAARQNQIAEQEEARRAAAAEKERARREKQLQEERQYQEALRKLTDDTLLSERQKIEKAFNDKIAFIRGSTQAEIQLRLALRQQQADALAAFDKAQADKLIQEQLRKIQEQGRIEELALRKQLAARELTEREFNDRLFQLKTENLEDQQAFLLNAGLSTVDIERQNVDLQIQQQKRLTDEEKAASEQRKQAAIAEANARRTIIAGLFNFAAGFANRQTALGKALAIAGVAASQAQAIGNAIQNATQSATGTGVAAVFTQPAFIATAVGSVLGAFGQVFSILRKTPGFAGGGKVVGSDGIPIKRSNGDDILATLKTGEVVLNSVQQSALGGDAVFKSIGVPGFADGGFVGRTAANLPSNDNLIDRIIEKTLLKIPAPIVTVEDINAGQNRVARVESRASV